MMDLFGIGAHVARWRKPYYARRTALERCIARQPDNSTRKAMLECALARVMIAEKIHDALTTTQENA